MFEELEKQFDSDTQYKEISIGPGWYDLVFDLHKKLLELDKNYKIHQIKSKLGGLRYYAVPSVESFPCKYTKIT